MSSAHFVVTKSPDLQTAHLAVSGEIDMSNSGALEETIADALMVRSVTTLVIDLAELTFLDSSGIKALLTGYHIATEQGATFRVDNPRGIVHRTLVVTGVLDILTARPPVSDDVTSSEAL